MKATKIKIKTTDGVETELEMGESWDNFLTAWDKVAPDGSIVSNFTILNKRHIVWIVRCDDD